jgi:hypothetical protein
LKAIFAEKGGRPEGRPKSREETPKEGIRRQVAARITCGASCEIQWLEATITVKLPSQIISAATQYFVLRKHSPSTTFHCCVVFVPNAVASTLRTAWLNYQRILSKDARLKGYTISPQGDNTLTVRNGKRALLKALLKADRLDRVKGDEEVKALIDDLLVSPVLRRVLCNPANFSFNPNSAILAKVSRTEPEDFDALVLGLLPMSHAKGQIVVEDFGFYGRDIHSRLIREERLIAGVNFLSELPEKLQRTVLLINVKIPSGTTVEDAEELARYEPLARGTNAFMDFVAKAIA